MSLSMTVMDLMKSDMALVEKAKLMKERFGCPGKKHPCIQSHAQGKMVCEGCWLNFFNVQINLEDRRKPDETTKEADSGTKESYITSEIKME